MPHSFLPHGRACLIGSQPLNDHREATRLILQYTPDIPTWVQLPVFKQEGMVPQFAAGLPGLAQLDNRLFVDTAADGFDHEMLVFFEEYLAVMEQGRPRDDSRFAIRPETAPGFFALLEALTATSARPAALKGHVTGPVTFCTGLKDQLGRAIFYHEALRDAAIKLIALKAAWQVGRLRELGLPVIIFIDEPALAGYGSSELISISKEDIAASLGEVIDTIHEHGALAGVHVCANTDWSLLLESALDIINFDAHGYFDRFVLYGDGIRRFLHRGGRLAWGMVPTLQPEAILEANVEDLWRVWQEKSAQLCALGIDAADLRAQSFITPSCGTGALTPELSLRVLELTRALSQRLMSF
jgi:hypothetical protein